MQMSTQYLHETATFLVTKGYTLEIETTHYGDLSCDDASSAVGRRYVLHRGASQCIALESVAHPDTEDRFFLELVRYNGLRTFSFPLDSWRYFDERIEFKFYAPAESGLGLSFIIDFEHLPSLVGHNSTLPCPS